MSVDRSLEQEVWRRSGRICEYCRMPEEFHDAPFQIDHIIARQHGGLTESENLALSCFRCNTYKGPNIASLDPLTGELVPLFNPRRDTWDDHFKWNGSTLVGRTPIGRATVALLVVNHPHYVAVRKELIRENRFPPAET